MGWDGVRDPSSPSTVPCAPLCAVAALPCPALRPSLACPRLTQLQYPIGQDSSRGLHRRVNTSYYSTTAASHNGSGTGGVALA